jgi:hypothetical protein
MKPDAEFLAECGQRILAVVPRGMPRRREQLDALAAECGIVIGSLCQTTDEASRLTEHLVRHPMPRWDFRTFQERAVKFHSLNQPEEPWKPDGFTPAELARLATFQNCPTLLEAYEALQHAAQEFLANLPPEPKAELLESCRREWRRIAEKQYPRTCEYPFLAINTGHRAMIRIEHHLLGRPLLRPFDLVASPEPASPAREKTLEPPGDILNKRRGRQAKKP